MITKTIHMDLVNRGVTPRVDAVQGESGRGRELAIVLSEAGQPWTSGGRLTGEVRYRSSDGTGARYSELEDGSTAVSVAGPTVTVGLSSVMLSVPGETHMDVVLSTPTGIVGIFPVDLIVAPDPSGDAAPTPPPAERWEHGMFEIMNPIQTSPTIYRVTFPHAFTRPPTVCVNSFVGNATPAAASYVKPVLTEITVNGFAVVMSRSSAAGTVQGVKLSWIACGV